MDALRLRSDVISSTKIISEERKNGQAVAERAGDNLNGFTDGRIKNVSSQGRNLALTVLQRHISSTAADPIRYTLSGDLHGIRDDGQIS